MMTADAAGSPERLIYGTLSQLEIPYTRIDHPPVYTVAEADEYSDRIPGAHCKNLFLRSKGGAAYYLLVLLNHKRADIRQTARLAGEKRLSFASPDDLQRILGILPGSVSPLAVAAPAAKDITVLLDQEIREYELISSHPGVNTATLSLKTVDLIRFLEFYGVRFEWVDV